MRKLALFFLLLALLPSRSFQQTDENQLTPSINDLAIVARLINGISLQTDFMRSSQNLNAVVGELLGIGDSNAIPELLKVKVKDLVNDMEGLLTAVKGLPASSSQNLEAISDTVPFLQSIDLEKLKKAVETDLQSSQSLWASATRVSLDSLHPKGLGEAAESLKYVLNTPIPENGTDQEDFFAKMRIFAVGVGHIASTTGSILDDSFDKLFKLLDAKSSFDIIPDIVKVSKEYSAKSDSFKNLVQALTDLKTSLTSLDPVIKKLQTSSIDSKNLEIIENMFSTNTISDQNLTIGLPNGISDLKMIFEDLNGKWLKENVANGKDMKMMVTALEPLKKFYESLKPVETSWNKLRKEPEIGRNIGNIASILKNGRLLNPATLPTQVNGATKCIPGLQSIDFSPVFATFESFYGGLEEFDVELKKLRTILEKTKKNSHLPKLAVYSPTAFFANPDEPVTKAKIERELAVFKKNDPNISETAPAIMDYLDSVREVKTDFLKDMILWSGSPFTIQQQMATSGLVKLVECLNTEKFDYSGTSAFSSFQQSFEVIKGQNDTEGDVKTFANALETLKKTEKKVKETVNGMQMSSRRRRSAPGPEEKGLLMLPDSGKVAQTVGSGVKALREISDVFDNRERVLNISTTLKEVDDVIQAIPEMDGKWTVENKKALEKLVDEVNKLNSFVEKERTLDNVWKIFGYAVSIEGAPIEAGILGTSVFETLDKSSSTKVKDAVPAFQDFPQLQLDFTGSRMKSLGAAHDLQPTLTKFFREFFTIDPASNVSSQPVEPSPNYLLYAGIGAGVLLFVAVVVGGYFAFRSWRKKKKLSDPERRLQYIGFKRPNEQMFYDVIERDDCDLAKEMIEKGVYLSMHNGCDGVTPLHETILLKDPALLEILVRNGADRTAVNSDNKTAEQVLDSRIEDDGPREWDPVKGKGELQRMKEVFNHRRHAVHPPKPLPLLPLDHFMVHLPVDTCEDFRITYPGRVEKPENYELRHTTHFVMPVDKNGVFHLKKDASFRLHFQAIFGPAVCVPVEWAVACAKDSANFHRDYDYRVKKVEFNGTTYDTLDKLKEFARGRHVGYGSCLSVYLFVDEEAKYSEILTNVGFYVLEFPKKQVLECRSTYRPDMRNFIVYEGASIDVHAEKLKDFKTDSYSVVSLEQFTTILLEMGITGTDGGVKIKKAQALEAKKKKVEEEKKGSNKKSDEQSIWV